MAIRPLLRNPESFIDGWFMKKILSDDVNAFDETLLLLPVEDEHLLQNWMQTTATLNKCKEIANGLKGGVLGQSSYREDRQQSHSGVDDEVNKPSPALHLTPSSRSEQSSIDNILRRFPVSVDKQISSSLSKYFEDNEAILSTRTNWKVAVLERPLSKDLASIELDAVKPEFKIFEYLNDAIVHCDWYIKRLLFSMLAEKAQVNLNQYIGRDLNKTSKKNVSNNSIEYIGADVAIRQNIMKKAAQLGWTEPSHSFEESFSKRKKNCKFDSFSNKNHSRRGFQAQNVAVKLTEKVKVFISDRKTLCNFNLRNSHSCDDDYNRDKNYASNRTRKTSTTYAPGDCQPIVECVPTVENKECMTTPKRAQKSKCATCVWVPTINEDIGTTLNEVIRPTSKATVTPREMCESTPQRSEPTSSPNESTQSNSVVTATPSEGMPPMSEVIAVPKEGIPPKNEATTKLKEEAPSMTQVTITLSDGMEPITEDTAMPIKGAPTNGCATPNAFTLTRKSAQGSEGAQTTKECSPLRRSARLCIMRQKRNLLK